MPLMNFYNLTILTLVLFAVSCHDRPHVTEIKYADGAITEPSLFGEGIISSEGNSEFSVMFSPDGRRVYFSRRAPGEKQKIYQSDLIRGVWSDPVRSAFSTDRDETPSITPNGELFFFGSERPIPSKSNQGNFDMNIWMMKKVQDGWSEAQPLPYPINDVQQEGEEWPSSNNNFIHTIDNTNFYYTSMYRGSAAVKLYQTEYIDNVFSDPIEITGLFEEDKYWIYSAVLSPDGKYLLFNSYGVPGGAGGEDIYVSRSLGGKWSPAVPIGSPVNTKNEESSPRFSRDGKYFFFSRAANRGNGEYGEWSIYIIETAYLQLDTLFP